MEISPGEVLQRINSPSDLRKLSPAQLPGLCDELRKYIIDVVSVHGGHLAAGLGVVELTVALHYVFNTPYDQLVWDVGHQAYGHKILTGRRESFITNRRYRGLSGFPKRSESQYDTFGTGHSSTSISAALGMAMASQYKGEKDRQHIAVIGDGAISAGIAFEGLCNAGSVDSNLLVILNDNSMSIDPNTSALEKYLKEIANPDLIYQSLRNRIKIIGEYRKNDETIADFCRDADMDLTKIRSGTHNLFEALNLKYFGPVDGHDLSALINILGQLRMVSGPKLLHIKTVKGKGFGPAEKDQTAWHATGAFDKITGKLFKSDTGTPQSPKYQEVFGRTILELAEKNERVVGVTPAMPTGSGLKLMMEKMPDRAFDVGICEQHAVTMSAGMATQGLKVFCNIYSTFMQRAYDQVIHDVAIQDLPVIFCLDRAGLVGEDGPTHHGAYDLAYMRCIPNMIVSAPMDERELRNLMYTAQLDSTTHPFVIRYPRGRGVRLEWKMPFEEIEIGRGRKLAEGEGIAILSIGHPGNFASEAIAEVRKEGMNPAHYDLRFVKPLDEELLHEVFSKFKKIITIEDGTVKGGFGSAILEFMNENGYCADIRVLGIPDRLVEHGTQKQLFEETGMDAEHIASKIRELAEGYLR